ncbi:MAG: HAMP domain-containing histidine kinase [Melioribacteraceae bacterium]|nr:HAMP domain-containing histidine kinase [Melioribacteraceae bacterium]
MTDKVHNNKLQILGKLAASLSHEIKNPLSVLKLNLDYLKLSKKNFDEETNECIDASLEAADIINQLIYNTLDFSRKNKDTFEECNINSIIDKSISITKGLANKKNIGFVLNLDENLSEIKGNETNILQVFINIISNGIEASNNNSKITINSYQNNGKVCAEVIDEGIGIKEEDLDKIFDEFFTCKENGTGLGLSVCKSILEAHEAKFDLKNNNESGTKFKIEFNR